MYSFRFFVSSTGFEDFIFICSNVSDLPTLPFGPDHILQGQTGVMGLGVRRASQD